MVEKKKKGIWKDAINKANEDLEGGRRQMWVWIKGTLGKQAGEADTGIATDAFYDRGSTFPLSRFLNDGAP